MKITEISEIRKLIQMAIFNKNPIKVNNKAHSATILGNQITIDLEDGEHSFFIYGNNIFGGKLLVKDKKAELPSFLLKINKRENYRLKLERNVEINGSLYKTIDISLEGLSLKTNKFEKDQKLFIKFNIGEEELSFEGIVKNKAPEKIGVFLSKASNQSRSLLFNYLKSEAMKR